MFIAYLSAMQEKNDRCIITQTETDSNTLFKLMHVNMDYKKKKTMVDKKLKSYAKLVSF